MAELIDGWWVTIRANTDQFREELSEASRLGSRFASDLTRAFEDAGLKGRVAVACALAIVSCARSCACADHLGARQQCRRALRQRAA